MWKSLKDSKTGLIGVIIVLVVFITAVTATLIVPYDPAKQDLVNKLMNPVFAREVQQSIFWVRISWGAISCPESFTAAGLQFWLHSQEPSVQESLGSRWELWPVITGNGWTP